MSKTEYERWADERKRVKAGLKPKRWPYIFAGLTMAAGYALYAWVIWLQNQPVQ